MSANSWDNSGGTGSDVGGLGPVGSSVWNMGSLSNGLPSSGSAGSGMDKQSRWGNFPAEASGSGLSDTSSGGWGQAPASLGKDTSASTALGWGRSDSDSGSDVGTKGWETSKTVSAGSSAWGLPMSEKSGSEWNDADIRQKNGLVNRDFSSPWDHPKSWGDATPEPQSASQNGASGSLASSLPAASSQQGVGQAQTPSSSVSRTQPAASSEQTTSAVFPTDVVDAGGDAKAGGNGAPQSLSRDEIMQRAINTTEPWGRTPIRQDTPWVVDEEPIRDPLPPIPKPPVVDPSDVQYSRIGTTGWEQLRSGTGNSGWIGSGRTRDDSGSWSISPPDAVGLPVGGQGVPVMPPGVGGMPAFRPPVERPVSSTGSLLAPAAASGWSLTPGLEQSDSNMWKDDDKKDLHAALGVVGMSQPPIRRNLSAGNWPAEDPSWNAATGISGMMPDMDDVLGQGRGWRSSRPGTAQLGQTGFRPKPDERGDAMFGVPPPSLQPGFRPSSRAGSHEDVAAGQWNPLSVKLPNATGGWGEQSAQWQSGMVDARLKAPPTANWNDEWNARKQPQSRSHILRQLTDIGFRKEEAQSALINNNMDVRLALTELTSGYALNDPARARLLRCASEDLSQAGSSMQSGPPVDISNSLFGQQGVRFPPGASASVTGRQQVVVDQLQQQQQQQRLLSGLLPSNMPLGPAHSQALQKLMQQQQDAQTRAALNAESAQVAALQQQHQMQLRQNVHAAVQANLIPPHLLSSTPSMNPTVAVKLQRMVQLYELFQKLNVQSQMIGSGPAGGNATTSQEQLMQAFGSVKQQIFQLQQEVVVALAATSTVPPPPLSMQQPPPSIVQPSNELNRGMPMTSDELAAASSKLNQWKQQPAMVADPMKQSLMMQQQNGSASSGWPVSASSSSAFSQGLDKSVIDNNSSGSAASQLDIEEFVPGKPWQGPSVRSVEDDPYITPGSVTRSAISAVDDAHVMNVLGGKSGVGAIGKPSSGAKMGNAVWSNDGMGADSRSPGIGGQSSHASHQQPAIGRSMSWAGGDRSSMSSFGPSSVNYPVTTHLRIRNLPHQVDNSFLKSHCERNGTLRYFAPSGDQVILSYVRVEDAIQAQQVLSTGIPGPGGIPPLVTEFVSDATMIDMIRLLEQTGMPGGVGGPVNVHMAAESSGWGAPNMVGAFGSGSAGSGASNLWSGGLSAEDNHGYLPSDLFGGQ